AFALTTGLNPRRQAARTAAGSAVRSAPLLGGDGVPPAVRGVRGVVLSLFSLYIDGFSVDGWTVDGWTVDGKPVHGVTWGFTRCVWAINGISGCGLTCWFRVGYRGAGPSSTGDRWRAVREDLIAELGHLGRVVGVDPAPDEPAMLCATLHPGHIAQFLKLLESGCDRVAAVAVAVVGDRLRARAPLVWLRQQVHQDSASLHRQASVLSHVSPDGLSALVSACSQGLDQAAFVFRPPPGRGWWSRLVGRAAVCCWAAHRATCQRSRLALIGV